MPDAADPYRRPSASLRKLVLGFALMAAAVVSSWSAPGIAADSDGEFRVFGSGEVSCERWLADRREGNPSARQSEMWVAGYLTAYNQFVHKDFDISARYDGNYLMTWLEEYCRKRPPNQLVIAARELVQMLRRRR